MQETHNEQYLLLQPHPNLYYLIVTVFQFLPILIFQRNSQTFGNKK